MKRRKKAILSSCRTIFYGVVLIRPRLNGVRAELNGNVEEGRCNLCLFSLSIIVAKGNAE